VVSIVIHLVNTDRPSLLNGLYGQNRRTGQKPIRVVRMEKTARISGSENQAEKESNAATPRKLVIHKEMVCRGVLNVAAKAATNQILSTTAHFSTSDVN
jgi:hypothetical protein